MSKKKLNILCFGDSNTWGYVAGSDAKERYTEQQRWPGIVQANLKGDVKIIEAGVSGRTTALEDPHEEHKNGLAQLPASLASSKPLDAVVLMLGTNDLKPKFKQTPESIAANIEQLLDEIDRAGAGDLESGSAPKVLLISPAPIRNHKNKFTGEGEEKVIPYSKQLGEQYAEIARKRNIEFIDAADIAEVSEIDGVHLTKEAHIKLANKVTEKLRNMLDIQSPHATYNLGANGVSETHDGANAPINLLHCQNIIVGVHPELEPSKH